jgi:hypothetical protein
LLRGVATEPPRAESPPKKKAKCPSQGHLALF